jgi:hypothetical protein
MIFAGIGTVIQYAISIWFCCILITIFWKMLSGEINTSGLLLSSRTGRLKLHRLQLLVVTLAFAFFYLLSAWQHRGATSLPDIPKVVLLLLLGSQGTFLFEAFRSGKIRRG